MAEQHLIDMLCVRYKSCPISKNSNADDTPKVDLTGTMYGALGPLSQTDVACPLLLWFS